MLGFAPLGHFPLGQPKGTYLFAARQTYVLTGFAATPVIIVGTPVGSSISGGTFSKGRWRQLKAEQRRRELAIGRGRGGKEREAREAAGQAAAEGQAARGWGRASEGQATAERA